MTKRLILTILFFCSPLWATTYYVDNCVTVGNDLSNGASPSTPWLTINKVNTSKFNPGDSILFQSTCTWREQLTVPSSGSTGKPITFGAYGTGAQPIISGADLLTSWISALPLYYAFAPVQPNQVFLDGQRLTLAASKAALATGQWWWDSTTNRVYVYDDPSGHTTEASARTNAITVTAEPYVTLQGLNAEKAAADNIGIYGVASYFVANGITSNFATGSGISLNAPANLSTPLQSAVIENSTFAYNGEKGVDSGGDADSLLIQHNIVHHNCLAVPGFNAWCGGIYIWSDADGPVGGSGISNGTPVARPTNVIAQYNQVFSNGVNSLSTRGFGIWFDTLGAGSQIRYNGTYGNSMNGIQLEYPSDMGATWVESVIYNLSFSNGTGISLSRHSHNSIVANNTVWGNSYSNLIVEGETEEPDAIGMFNNTISNNIAVNWIGTDLMAAYGGENDGTNGYGNIYTYNDFGPAASAFIQWGIGVYESTYSAWETAAGNCGTQGCSHSVRADPQFVNAAAAQFWLAGGSPAIDAGLNLGSPYNIGLLPGSSWPNSVLTGDQNAYGSGWEIGAFLYVPTITPPSNLQAVAH